MFNPGPQEYPGWFWLHVPLGVAAFIGGLLGVIWGAKLPSDDLTSSLYDAHKVSVIMFDLGGSGRLATRAECQKRAGLRY